MKERKANSNLKWVKIDKIKSLKNDSLKLM